MGEVFFAVLDGAVFNVIHKLLPSNYLVSAYKQPLIDLFYLLVSVKSLSLFFLYFLQNSAEFITKKAKQKKQAVA